MNYTKGTWTVRDTNIGTLIEIPSDLPGKERIEIALLQYGLDTAANARLISSSPAMYEALKIAEKFFDAPLFKHSPHAEVQMLYATIKSALAEAEAK